MKKFSQILINNKLYIVITILFILGLYHLLMCLVKLNSFNLDREQISTIKPILIRFYHLSYNLLIGFGFLYAWSKRLLWIWLYVGFKIVYGLLLFIPLVRESFNKSLIDGLGFGIIIIVILLIIRNEEST